VQHGLEFPIHQFLHDNAIDLVSLRLARPQISEAAPSDLFGIYLTVDEPARPGETEAFEPALDSPLHHNLGDVQPTPSQSPRSRHFTCSPSEYVCMDISGCA